MRAMVGESTSFFPLHLFALYTFKAFSAMLYPLGLPKLECFTAIYQGTEYDFGQQESKYNGYHIYFPDRCLIGTC